MLALAILTGPAAGSAAAQTIWFQQPTATLAQNFSVNKTTEQAAAPPAGFFTVTQWQPNPYTTTHVDMPVIWNMGSYTGLPVPIPRGQYQAGILNRIGSTGVQFYQGAIGINLNSADFSVAGTPGFLVGIMPGYQFPDLAHIPFALAGTVLVFSVQMQVVSTSLTRPPNNPKYNGAAYVALDLRFVDLTHPNSKAITISVGAFSNHGAHQPSLGYEAVGGGHIIVKTSVAPASPYNTVVPGTAGFQTAVWTGFQTFAAGLTAANLAASIQAVQADTALLSSLGLTAASYSANPADYALTDIHVNSELNYAGPAAYVGGSVQMGLTVQNMQVVLW